MMLEIALDAEEEWDSSSSWEPRVRKAVEAAIAESQALDPERPGEYFEPIGRRGLLRRLRFWVPSRRA